MHGLFKEALEAQTFHDERISASRPTDHRL